MAYAGAACHHDKRIRGELERLPGCLECRKCHKIHKQELQKRSSFSAAHRNQSSGGRSKKRQENAESFASCRLARNDPVLAARPTLSLQKSSTAYRYAVDANRLQFEIH